MPTRHGITVLESLLAITVAGIGLLAVLGVGTDARRRRTHADLAAAAGSAAARRATALVASACGASTDGDDDSGGVARRWSVSRGPRALLLVRAVAYPTARPTDSTVVLASRWCE